MKSLKIQLFTFIAVLFTNFFLLNTSQGYIVKAQEEPTWVIDKNTGCKVWLSLWSNESITWSGECVNGKAHGNGILVHYKNNIEYSKTYCTTKNGLSMVNGRLTASVETSSYNFGIFKETPGMMGLFRVIKGVVNKDINLSYTPVADYIMGKAGHFASKNCPEKVRVQYVTILLYYEGEDNYAVKSELNITSDTNEFRRCDNVARNKRISQEEVEYNAKLKEKRRLEQEEKARQQAELAEKKRLEEEKKRQEMEAREKQEDERKRQEMAARKAKEDRERVEAIKRRDEFTKKNGVKECPDISELSVNPFVYEGKTIAIKTHFLTMQTATQGNFFVDVGNGAFFVVSDIPKGMFKEAVSIIVLAGRVLGKIELQLPLLGLMQVPHLKFVGVHFCQDKNCNDIIQ